MPRQLLTVAHSYVVRLNRRLPHEIAVASAGRWQVTAVSPTLFRGSRDLRAVPLEPGPDDTYALKGLPARTTQIPHVFTYKHLRPLLRGQRWDLVHCWEEPFIFAGGQVAFHTPRQTPIVYATFQNLAKRYPPPFNFIERYAMRRAAGWIAFGHTVEATLQHRAGYNARPHRIIPPGVDIENFHPDPAARTAVHRELNWQTDGPPVVGYLGRFIPEKGIALLITALSTLTVPWRALFVGKGPLEPDLRAFAARYPDQVRLCTDVTHNAVPAHLNAMDMLCAPSQTTPRWREQFGRMLIEAFAVGLPVLGSDSGEIPYVIAEAGRVLPEGDVAAWTAALSDLLQNPSTRQELSQRSLARVHAEFAWPVIARRYVEFFDEIVETRA